MLVTRKIIPSCLVGNFTTFIQRKWKNMFFGAYFTNDQNRPVHVDHVCSKATFTHGALRNILFGATPEVKLLRYLNNFTPQLMYGIHVWLTYTKINTQKYARVRYSALGLQHIRAQYVAKVRKRAGLQTFKQEIKYSRQCIVSQIWSRYYEVHNKAHITPDVFLSYEQGTQNTSSHYTKEPIASNINF